ncbi:hypothetical protein [Xanthomonas vesicatoria]|uniref:hypothetical protein n=1 Tax=Xanthomonas vesicatoria TaxID=56460 RepID=UPI000A8556D5|nr:hypothetical protein [Xanthomonas vesicatoria]MCC8556757.1 hypothetical protein [Xanthomonas vesicatoria]MCC8600701.1 hypothetical protein [Xanthomonas vesicatoria]MCC8610275.1 hypothetical protein [Xanthomonas vesicatoria]MCC8672616.1 hypothetical protein [Xanthomonas vesicatoria]MCC8680006.1 hypothetical protein [Xanthomonas vesicatoria]
MLTTKKSLHDFLTSGSGLAILVVALVFSVLSLIIFLLASWVQNLAEPWNKTAGPFREVGSLLLTVGALDFLLRTKIWKEAIDSVSERLHLKESTLISGLTDCWKFDEVPWAKLFGNSKTITIVAISARPLLVDRLAILRDFLSKDGVRLKLVLSDFREDELMGRFDAEFNEKPGTRSTKLKDALKELLKALNKTDLTKVDICLSKTRVPYSAYKFDDDVLFVPYIAEPTRDTRRITALLFGEGQVQRAFLAPDFAYLTNNGNIDHNTLQGHLN